MIQTILISASDFWGFLIIAQIIVTIACLFFWGMFLYKVQLRQALFDMQEILNVPEGTDYSVLRERCPFASNSLCA